MPQVRFPRDVVEFVIGPPDAADRWSCGCRAVEHTKTDYVLVPCFEHRMEFDENTVDGVVDS